MSLKGCRLDGEVSAGLVCCLKCRSDDVLKDRRFRKDVASSFQAAVDSWR